MANYLNTGTSGDLLTDDFGNLLTDSLAAIDVTIFPVLIALDDSLKSPVVGGGFIAAQRLKYSAFYQ